ncbi:MAG TPA: hypothetical protein VMV92_19490 [Streptosporangiaceae bacterium]|nr:hypothetical protein [Streptosporangiaceae bacterium]
MIVTSAAIRARLAAGTRGGDARPAPGDGVVKGLQLLKPVSLRHCDLRSADEGLF